MSKTDKKYLIIFSISIILLIINLIYGKPLLEYIYIAGLAIILAILIILLGITKDKSIYKKDTLQQVFIYVFIYLLFIYLCGLLIGFLKSLNSYSFINIIKNITPIILELSLIELIRYQSLSKRINNLNKILMIATFVLVDVVLSLNIYNLSVPADVLKILCLVLLPSLAKNFFLNYLCKIGGFWPCLLYVLITKLYIYFIPIIPDFGDYMQNIIDVIFPLVLYIRFKKLYTKDEIVVQKRSKSKKIIFIIIISLVIIMSVYLISGKFTYQALTVGSGSMIPTLNIGDIVIIKKINNYAELKKKDILIHKNNNRIVIHRIIDIKAADGHYIYQTKGDNNADAYQIDKEHVIGKYLFKIPYIGYPTVWLSQIINKK